MFCWNRLLGTQHADETSYPATGLNDPGFPEPAVWSLREFGQCYLRQLAFPFDADAVRRATFGVAAPAGPPSHTDIGG